MEMNEATARTPLVDERALQAEIDDPMLALVVRQQELIVRLSDPLAQATRALIHEHKPVSLRAELDELFGAIASIRPEDLKRAADTARLVLDAFKRCAVGGGAARGAS